MQSESSHASREIESESGGPGLSQPGPGTEPWPWILAACLLAMISISSTFAWVAVTHPDPVVVDERYELENDSFSPRLVEPEATP